MVKFPELEDKWLKYWQENKIFEKSLAKPAPHGNFVFFEGPPTANGKPGIHHVLARAFKDLIPRYKTMRGYRVERKAGWDTQGLPVELQVEKALGFKGKMDIEDYGVEKFNTKCKEDVWKYKEDWEKLTERMGYWLNLTKPYVTYEKSYIESLWWIFQQVHKADLLYQDYKVLPHCPRCGTALSSHEVALGYKSVPDKAVFIKFHLVPGQKFGNSSEFEIKDTAYVLSWTTTPWTLPGNVALAVGEKIKYVGVRVDGKQELLIMADNMVESIFAGSSIEKVHEYKGSELVGLKYDPLFDIKSLQNNKSHQVYSADFVTTTEGTGVVHTAVMYGEDDFNLGTEVGLPKYHTVDENGNFTADVPKWQGKFVKDKKVEEGIVADLNERGLLLKEEIYTHDYPFCWRCSTPLLYYAKPSWFIKMSVLREELKQANAKVNWFPDHIKDGRFGEWLEGLKDWAISRERYWGTPLPIWRCSDCKHDIVIGSLAELEQVSGNKFKADFDLHRPYIDQIHWPCKQCNKGEMKRVPEVADCWFDSGSMPFAQWGYPHAENSKQQLTEHYPADFIAEAIDQTRGWFYTLLAIASILKKAGAIKEVPPYKNVICLGHINDKNGQKMSKSKGNIVDPWEVMNTYGADALRLHLYTANQPGEPKNFNANDVDQIVKKTLLIMMNVITFYELYKSGENKSVLQPKVSHVMDKWILAMLHKLVKDETDHLDKYEVTEAGRKLASFVTELSTWYVRRSRDRFKEEGEDKQAALATLGFTLLTLSKLLAPFMPFVAEEVYKRSGGTAESVHLENWPTSEPVDEKIINNMQQARQVVEQALAERAKAGIKVRQPLGRLHAPVPKELLAIVAEEVNVMEVVEADSLILETSLTDELKAMGMVREFIRQINSFRKDQKLTINDKVSFVICAPKNISDILIKSSTEVNRAIISSGLEFTEETQAHELNLGDINITISLKS